MDETIKRKLIKKDAKMLLAEDFRRICLVSLPLIVLEFLLQFVSYWGGNMQAWTRWGLIAVILLATIPCILVQASYVLAKLNAKECPISSAFFWLYNPQRLWLVFRMVGLYFGIFILYGIVMFLLYHGLWYAANAFAAYLQNPSFLVYYRQLFIVLIYVGFFPVEVLTTPAINLLVQSPDSSVITLFSRSMKAAKNNFRVFFVFQLTFLALTVGVAILQEAGMANLQINGANIFLTLLYGFIGVIMYLAGSYLKIYMNMATLSYVNIHISSEN